MKVLKFRDLAPEDSLLLTFEGTFDPRAPLEHELEPFLHALEEQAGDWIPEVVKGKRGRKYSRPVIWKALEERREERGTDVYFYRTSWPALDMSLSLWFPPLPPRFGIMIEVQPLSFFMGEERCRKFVDMVCAWAARYPVSHASAHGLADSELCGSPLFGRDMQTSIRDGFDKLYEVFWLNVFGPKLVESVGRERMLSTPAWRVEELPNGSVLLVTWPTAADFASEPARQAQARAFVHLRPDLELPTVLSTLRERSAALAPVEPRFPPEVAPLLWQVVDAAPLHERQRKIAELNAWQPPEPEEWLPAEQALPPDVEDVALAREHYGTLAESLVALLHSQVPSVFDTSPQSLTEVDYHFWFESFPERYERQLVDARAVPAIGAYLGEVLVRNLGGEWLPRRKLEEAQVRVGPRVWLPFARAWRYMRSRQSLLDCSLSQLYRVAERCRG
jgi:hypothetical protein